MRLTNIQRSVGDFTGAMGTLLRAEQRSLKDAGLAAELGELYLAQGRPREALAAYQRAIALQPEELSHYLRSSEIWRTQGELGHALTVLWSGVEVVPQPATLYASIAELHLLRSDAESARAILEEAITELGDRPELLLAMGAVIQASGDTGAEAWYAKIVAERPTNASAHVALANYFMQNDRADEAIAAYRHAISLNSQDAGQYAILGNALAALDRYEEAIDMYQQAMTLAPTQIDLYTQLARLYQDLELWDEAQEIYLRGMAIEPTDGIFLMQYADFFLQQGEESEALAILEYADHVAPTASMLTARAQIYLELDDAESAERDLMLALQKEPGSIEAYIALSDFYQSTNNIQRAQDVLDEAALNLGAINLPRR